MYSSWKSQKKVLSNEKILEVIYLNNNQAEITLQYGSKEIKLAKMMYFKNEILLF